MQVVGGRYWLVELLGAGHDEVWRGHDEFTAGTVAVRLRRDWPASDTGYRERFRTNLRAVVSTQITGFAPIVDYGVDESAGAFVVADFIEDESLSRLLARTGMRDSTSTMDMVAQAADALAAAHAIGVVHRGIKPTKMFVGPAGELRLTDLWGGGFAPRQPDASITVETARYLSPEEARGESVSGATDVYALGVVAYRCLAGRPPFDGRHPLELAIRHVRDRAPSLPPSIPDPVRTLVAATLSKHPADRPTARDLAALSRDAAPR